MEKLRKIFRGSELEREKDEKQTIFLGQLLSIGVLLISFVVYWLFGQYFPDFVFSELWLKSDNILDSLWNYWPLFAYVTGISLLLPVTTGTMRETKDLLKWDSIVSILAGIWEEIGYRGIFIFTAMVTLWLTNYFFEWVVILLVAAFFLWLAFGVIQKWLPSILILILGGALCWLIAGWAFLDNPIIWFYTAVVFPVLKWVSFGALESIVNAPGYSVLFIMGAISANAKFRDGHKYQGIIGLINSWIVGFVLLHMMLYHGILVGIIAHAAYDLIIGIVRFSKRAVLSKL